MNARENFSPDSRSTSSASLRAVTSWRVTSRAGFPSHSVATSQISMVTHRFPCRFGCFPAFPSSGF